MKLRVIALLLPLALFVRLAAHPDDASKTSAAASAPAVAPAPIPAGPLGSGAWKFTVASGWAQLPTDTKLGPTHGGVAVDRAGNVYVSSDGPAGLLVFGPDGKLLRSIAPEFSGIHGLALREENGVEFLYGAHLRGHQVVKLTLAGETVWSIPAPLESGLYKTADDYRPTAIAVAPDGRIFVADGYGASVLHEYTAERKWVRVIGAKGKGDGEFSTCHGLALDMRGPVPLLLVCDRANRRLVHLGLDGKFVRTFATGLRLPCAVAMAGEFTAVAELEGRVVILDRDGKIAATLGDNPDQKQWANFKVAPEFWRDGIFTAPHGLAFDSKKNLYVQDWNYAGRLTKLALEK